MGWCGYKSFDNYEVKDFLSLSLNKKFISDDEIIHLFKKITSPDIYLGVAMYLIANNYNIPHSVVMRALENADKCLNNLYNREKVIKEEILILKGKQSSYSDNNLIK